jgi:outer membrane protein assembly factor BamB
MKSVHGRQIMGVGLLVALSLLVAACGSSSKSSSSTTKTTSTTATTAALPTTWSLPGADLQNTRDVGGPINSSNVSTLGVAWTVPIVASGTFGAYATTPVVSNGILYTQDLASNVYAINLASGKLLWLKKYNSPDVGPNGVTVVNGTVYGATEESAFALQAATGEQLWSKKLTRNANEGVDQAPGYNNGTVYVSTVPGNTKAFYKGNGQAILWALNAETGETKWKFEEVPANLWSSKNTAINSGGGTWDPPTFGPEGNLYIGIANPAPFPGTTQFPAGTSRPGPNLYTDSIVKLDAQTGKLIWYYQLTPHDISDHDLENSPILSTDDGTPIVIDGGKAGILIAVNAETGKLVWKTPVGVHNGNDEIGVEVEKNPAKVKYPWTDEPGDLGGIESQLASNGKTVFAAVNNLAVKYTGPTEADAEFVGGIAAGTGELVAVNEATGAVEWDAKLPSSAYGAASIENDVVFTTTFNGTLYAFETTTGKELWKTKLSAGTNTPVTIDEDTVITAGTFPQAPGQKALITAYRLGATGTLPTSTPPPAKSTTTTKSSSTTAPTTAGVVKIEANPTGLLKYTVSQITTTAGPKTIEFTNQSPLEHSVAIESSSKKIVGQTPIFDHGTKSFKVTLTAGTYTYFCTVPGHREAGMLGTLTVK